MRPYRSRHPFSVSETSTIPTFQDRDEMWRRLDFPSDNRSYPRTTEFVAALRERYANGGVLFHSFSIPTHPIFDWYLQRNRLHECNFFEMFWRASTPAASLSQQPAPLNFYEVSLFQWTTPFHLAGDLSAVLFSGGAYSHSQGYSNEARRLGEAAAAELLGGDYEESLLFHCHSAWSDFFMNVAWDYTFVVISKPRRAIHVILATDTD